MLIFVKDLSENELKEFGAKTIATMLDTNRFIQKIDISGKQTINVVLECSIIYFNVNN